MYITPVINDMKIGINLDILIYAVSNNYTYSIFENMTNLF